MLTHFICPALISCVWERVSGCVWAGGKFRINWEVSAHTWTCLNCAGLTGATQFTTQQEPTVLSDHYFSQIKSSGRGGVQLTQCRIIWLPVKCQTINVKGMAMVEVCVQIFTLVTRGQFSPQIIISGRYWRYLQTWHLPPPHIIFSCNKSGFPAPGNRGGFVTTAHNYYHLDGQYPAINQYFSSAQHLSRLPWIENFIKNVNISNVYCKSSDGQDHPEKSI